MRPRVGHRFRTALMLGLLTFACAHPGRAPGPGACPVSLVTSAEVPVDSVLRFRMRFSAGGRTLQLESVVERRDDELVIAAFAPFGVRLFAVRQRGRAIEVLDAARRDVVPIAQWVVDALHRAYWIESPSSRVPPEGARWEREGERITERRRDGRVAWREFAVLAAASADAAVTIEYAGGPSSPVGRSVAVRNPWCGYEAIVVALESTPAHVSPSP
jgi:hypothetical protein